MFLLPILAAAGAIPVAWGLGGGWRLLVVVLGELSTGTIKGGVAEKGWGYSWDGEDLFPHILPTPPRTLGWRKTGRGLSAIRA